MTTPLERAIALLDQAMMRAGNFANPNITVVRRDEAEAIVREALAPVSETRTPAEPPKGLLVSIALRLDHGLLLPGFAESEEEHKRRIECALSDARRAWEECTGNGFWSPERNAEYEAMQRPTPPGPYQPPMVYDPKQGKMVKPGGAR